MPRWKRCSQEEHFEFGDVIVRQDDPAESFYLLTHGRARALKIKPDGQEILVEAHSSPAIASAKRLWRTAVLRSASVRCNAAVDVTPDRS